MKKRPAGLIRRIVPAARAEEDAAKNEKQGPEPAAYATFLARLLEADKSKKGPDVDLAVPDDPVARSIAEHWKRTYLDPDFRLYLYGKDDPLLLPVGGAHAFVVLGYELQDGEMAEELKGRCEAAAAAARAFPNSILVCSGGPSGKNNPQGHTEAGMMRDYLISRCGIAPEKIFTDETSMNTAENAINTFTILRAQGIESMTLVTSAYHLRWGEVLYNALGAQYRQQYGYAAKIVGNFCLDIEPDNPLFRQDALIAVLQLAMILNIPREMMQKFLPPFPWAGRKKPDQ